MQITTKRVRTIYSVIASENRLDILRILNSKGPLSYSELKTLAGFKSKKESGKFAYHLRKLVRQALVTLNRAERRYTVTNLGRLILNLTRQIEEQSMIESGKIYVRTSREMMEEFKPEKILQSLVNEAGMPVNLAEKMASEAETRLYKFRANYLTAPLIREIVNGLLIENGYEEYRHKLTRIGLPIYDVTKLLNQSSRSANGVDSIVSQTSKAVFSEYLLLNQLARDVTDSHLSGDIHISNSGAWGLKPDTVFIDLNSLPAQGIQLQGKLLNSVKITMPNKLNDALANMVLLTSELKKEINSEIVYNNFLDYIIRYTDNQSMIDIKDNLTQMIKMISQVVAEVDGPFISLDLSISKNHKNDDKKITKISKVILESYSEYIKSTVIPKVGFIIAVDLKKSDNDLLNKIIPVIKNGGYIAINNNEKTSFSLSGISKSINNKKQAGGIIALHSLSINLPRLAYESNRDDMYFRAKVILILKIAISALSTRRGIIDDMIGKDLLPLLRMNSGIISNQKIPLIINFTGLNESIDILTDSKATGKEKAKLISKILDAANEQIASAGKKLGEEYGISTISDDSGIRFANLDTDKFGKVRVKAKNPDNSYSQSIIINPNETDTIDNIGTFIEMYKGGFSVSINVTDLNAKNIIEITKKTGKKIPFFKFYHKMKACISCAKKNAYSAEKCIECNSTSLVEYPHK